MDFETLETISEEDFIENYIKMNKPVIVKDSSFDKECWTPQFLKSLMGDLPVQIYDSLFDLQEVTTLSYYVDNNFDVLDDYRDNVPYIRWYSKLKDVEYAWSDEAFKRMSEFWEKPSFLPDRNLLIPAVQGDEVANPVTDLFPYRGLLIAAKGARTRTHTDPFCSDAIVSQFYGEKEVSLYSPERAKELTKASTTNSFSGFVDVRADDIKTLSHKPDFHGFIGPGDVVYIPHGWIHDVIVTKDSISVTWNFIHEMGGVEYIDYLMDAPENDSEFEVLNFFYSLAGKSFSSANDIVKHYNEKFSKIEEDLA